MSKLVDENNRPLQKEEKPAASKNNGKSNSSVMDIRAVPTGTLIYNLILTTFDERAAGMVIGQMEQMKEVQKMVTDPPPLLMARAQLAQQEERRFAMASELNIRFLALDKQRIAECELEVLDKGADDASGD